jgi:hypothetical protein
MARHDSSDDNGAATGRYWHLSSRIGGEASAHWARGAPGVARQQAGRSHIAGASRIRPIMVRRLRLR